MIIGVINIKGGVGKTTSSLAIATAAQRSGLSVTVVDTDPQGSATLWARAGRLSSSHALSFMLSVPPQ